MHLKSVKYACKYALKLPKYALKTPEYALKNSKTSITNLKTVKNKSICKRVKLFFYKMYMPKSHPRPVKYQKKKLLFEKKKMNLKKLKFAI